MTTLTIFANFYINDAERFLRLQDSFHSFKDVRPKKWVINVRGKFKSDVTSFLKENLGDELTIYELSSKEGWFTDTQKMLTSIDTDFVFFWVEDHINTVPVENLAEILDEMKGNGAEYLPYSWWVFGKQMQAYDNLEKTEHKNTFTFILDKKSQKKLFRYTICSYIRIPYIISMTGIFSLDLFKKIINNEPDFLRWHPRYLPFNFEKQPDETQWLPIHYAIPKYELFCSVDDDLRVPGSSLQSRGLYPIRESRPKGTIVPPAQWRVLFQKYIGRFIPEYISDIKYTIGNFKNKVKRSIYLFRKGI